MTAELLKQRQKPQFSFAFKESRVEGMAL